VALLDDGLNDHPFGCGCGRHTSGGLRAEAVALGSAEDAMPSVVQQAVLRSVFPHDATRRALLRTVGGAALLGALAEAFPLGTATAVAQERGRIEKPDLKIGFIPITCASPIIMADPLGFYKRQGLNVEVIRAAGWAVVRDRALAGEFDAAHMLTPMPIAISMGLGSAPQAWTIPAIENINGQAITLSLKHKDRRDPKSWKGMRFAIPFDYSIHNYLLRYYLAENGIDPDNDVTLRVTPPPEMVANLRADNIDGFLGPDPVNQRAVFDGVGFIHMLSKQIWDGHPCCAFAISRTFANANPNTFLALTRAIIEATVYANKAENRREIAAAIAPANYLNQPQTIVEQVLTGTFADGLGNVIREPLRASFDPFPWQSFGVWIMTQMKRWGQVRGDVDYAGVAERVLLTTGTGRLMAEMGVTPPAATTKTFVVMGKTFDPAQPEAYLASFAIKRAA